MFTGIIEALGHVKEISSHGTNKTFWIESTLSPELKVDQSIAHDGVCLTVEEQKNNLYRVTAVKETLEKTTLNQWEAGTTVNLERSLLPTSRLDGHFVQGHVDTTAVCTGIEDRQGSLELSFSFPEGFALLIVEKGSIAVNGISLTVFDAGTSSFKVAIIPYTWEFTNLKLLKRNQLVNLEFDMLGKYILRNSSHRDLLNSR